MNFRGPWALSHEDLSSLQNFNLNVLQQHRCGQWTHGVWGQSSRAQVPGKGLVKQRLELQLHCLQIQQTTSFKTSRHNITMWVESRAICHHSHWHCQCFHRFRQPLDQMSTLRKHMTTTQDDKLARNLAAGRRKCISKIEGIDLFWRQVNLQLLPGKTRLLNSNHNKFKTTELAASPGFQWSVRYDWNHITVGVNLEIIAVIIFPGWHSCKERKPFQIDNKIRFKKPSFKASRHAACTSIHTNEAWNLEMGTRSRIGQCNKKAWMLQKISLCQSHTF